MSVLTNIIARTLFAIPLAVFGLFHFMNAGMMAGMVPAWLPGGGVWVYITGAGLILAAIAFLVNRFADLAALLLGIMLLSFALTVHLPGLSNPEMAQMAMPNLLKDTALAGAAFVFAGFFARQGNGIFKLA